MDFLGLVDRLNLSLELPATVIFFATALILTYRLKFIQFRSFRRFIALITQGVAIDHNSKIKTLTPFQALFTAMSTTIGVGNVVGPSLAILAGGPGALFWLVIYIIFASATKYTEVTLALETRKEFRDGYILGGPTQYLRLVHPIIANWYGFATIFLFASWSGVQSNTLAEILKQEGIPVAITGLILASLVMIVLFGGAKRVGNLASKLVPMMFVLYISFSFLILFKNFLALKQAFGLIFNNIFTPASAIGGFFGATIFQAIKSGAYQAAYITEAGVGTSSIPHAISDAKKPSDQGVLALYSMAADGMLCVVSGLLVLVTGVWKSECAMTSRLIYDVFKFHSPLIGKWILLASVSMFVITTVIGNGFNGAQSFGSFTRHRGIKTYFAFVALVTFFGAISPVPAVWKVMSLLLVLVAVPNLLGLIYLAFKYPNKIKDN
jgi:AGCS family alanine or glycine:cation symporter